METFEHNGHKFKVEVISDQDIREPWKEHDGHGVISEWTTRGKHAGERILCVDHGSKRYYDFQATMVKARAEGWGLSDEAKAHLRQELGRELTQGDITAEAVNKDYERMRRWCEGEWYWVGVSVTMLKEDDEAPNGYFETIYKQSLWGIESDAGDYLKQVATELAEECIAVADIKEDEEEN